MKYYFIADDFYMSDMSCGTLLQVSVNPINSSKYDEIWVFESDDDLFDFESLEENDSRVKPYHGTFDCYHNFEEEDEFDNVRWNWDKLTDQNIDIVIDYTVEYVNGTLISEIPDFEKTREVLRSCVIKDELSDKIIYIIENGNVSDSKLQTILELLT